MNDFPVMFLNSNDGNALLAFGDGEKLEWNIDMHPTDLQSFLDRREGKYIFGYLAYEFKNCLNQTVSSKSDLLDFPVTFFWCPKYVVKFVNQEIEFVQGEKCADAMHFVSTFQAKLENPAGENVSNFDFKPRISKQAYMDGVSMVKRHIQLGDIYELNFCQEFFAENCAVDDYLAVYRKLNNITKAPFSAYFNWQNFAVFCGSPERFLQKKNNRLLSQPIKGTAPRNENESRDLQLKNQLQNDPKERAENIMIVDLVRNDLSRIAVTNSVQVDELCEIYSFETVHQMISTVSCTVEDSISFKDIVKATFPMGSMTGAPKLRAMELIDKYEAFNRGLYAGSIGYIHPNGDFDFNVVIRTVLYNATKKYLSCSVGGAITIQSDPEKEYEECLVKVKRILDGLNA